MAVGSHVRLKRHIFFTLGVRARHVVQTCEADMESFVKPALEAFQSALIHHQIREANLPVDVMHHISILIVMSHFV